MIPVALIDIHVYVRVVEKHDCQRTTAAGRVSRRRRVYLGDAVPCSRRSRQLFTDANLNTSLQISGHTATAVHILGISLTFSFTFSAVFSCAAYGARLRLFDQRRRLGGTGKRRRGRRSGGGVGITFNAKELRIDGNVETIRSLQT